MRARWLKDKLFSAFAVLVSLVFFAAVVHVVAYVTWKGLPVVLAEGASFFTERPAAVVAERPGGIAPALVGTAFLTLTSLAIATPLSLAAAIFAVEFPRNPLSRAVRVVARTFLEVPSIVVGMLAFSLVVLPVGRFNALAGTVALSIIMLPYVYTYTESALSSVPKTYIEAAYSLGMTRPKVVLKVTLGIARSGVMRGIILATMKAVGETAPLIFTVFGARNVIFGGVMEPIDALPLMIFHFIQTAYENWRSLAWGGAFVLLVIYLSLYAVYRLTVKRVRL